jgi:prephenate dehydratase
MTAVRTSPSIAYQGERGSFSELAILRLCGEDARALACTEFGDVTHAVRAGAAEFGLLPVANTLAGPVQASMDVLAESGLHVVMASEMPINLCLLALPGATLEMLRTVESHPVALRQCGRFLLQHPQLTATPAYDTAGAARLVSTSGDRTRAAAASARAGRLNGLVPLLEAIEDRADNVTRFVIVSRDPTARLPAMHDRAHQMTNLR